MMNLKNKIIFLFALLSFNVAFAEKPKITVSSKPLYSITKMITGDLFEINVVHSSNSCPHHHHLKPSDMSSISGSKLMIYVDDSFESFSRSLFAKAQGIVVKISDMENVNFADVDGKKNWHFWLDLENILVFQDELAKVLVKEFPDFQETIVTNRDNAKGEITKLTLLKSKALEGLSDVALMSDSLGHLFKDSDAKIYRLYKKENSSLRDFKDQNDVLSQNSDICIILDSNQDEDFYKKFNKLIVKLNAENWSKSRSFIDEYLIILDGLAGCK